MSESASRTVERHCDVCVVGGSAAGLAAALQLGRQRRSVIVVDSGEPRNAPAAHMHSFLGHDGRAPSELLAAGRAEVRGYGVEVLDGRVLGVSRTEPDGFRLELAGGNSVVARRVVAATGLVDELPAIEGLAEHWGGDVIHCPFCHGYEARDQRIVQLVTHSAGLHPAPLFRQLTDRLTIVVHDGVAVDDEELDALAKAGATVIRGTVRRVVAGADGHVNAVETADGVLPADVVAIGPRFHARAEPFAALGLRPTAHPNGLGDFIETDATGATSVPGLYAAGNVTDPSQQVLGAAAHGSRVGTVISFSLAQEDVQNAARRSGNAEDWDHRYGGDQLWSGNPNGSLVNEVAGLAPGRALDVGAGEGGDAVWLAEQGWTVTANDISQRALDRVDAEARRRGLHVDLLCADANALDPFEGAVFDLVSAQYASILRTPDLRAVHNLLGAVAPGGTLLVVSHDLHHTHAGAGEHDHGRPYDADAYVRVDDFADQLNASSSWQIEVHETRLRPPGSATAAIHVEDIVLRARRRDTP
jgi:thioredoxin reductase/SAM-dependent methyltransferase